MTPLRALLTVAFSLLLLTALAPASAATSAELGPCPSGNDVGATVIVNGAEAARVCCGVGWVGAYCRSI